MVACENDAFDGGGAIDLDAGNAVGGEDGGGIADARAGIIDRIRERVALSNTAAKIWMETANRRLLCISFPLRIGNEPPKSRLFDKVTLDGRPSLVRPRLKTQCVFDQRRDGGSGGFAGDQSGDDLAHSRIARDGVAAARFMKERRGVDMTASRRPLRRPMPATGEA